MMTEIQLIGEMNQELNICDIAWYCYACREKKIHPNNEACWWTYTFKGVGLVQQVLAGKHWAGWRMDVLKYQSAFLTSFLLFAIPLGSGT